MTDRYAESERMLERARATIPLGSQTFSKSMLQYPPGAAPLFLSHGQGARTVDVDGNEYIDLVCGLAAVLLGHRDPDVDAAVVAQLSRGVTLSLPTCLEAEVAELIVDAVPCAEQVRFGKNGSDATAAAVRLARAHTGRDHVAVCGYHGWQDWYIGSTTRHLGVPEATRALTHAFAYGDSAGLEALLRQHAVAAVVMEPMNVVEPPPGFLPRVRELCTRQGALLVFDETVTGFRFDVGGAQALFGVTPDLATFGKGLANGMPLSAVVGPTALMAGMERIFFSTTFGGEALSLAAARAVLQKLRREPVVAALRARGEQLLAGCNARIAANGLGGTLRTSGHPSWSFLVFEPTGRYSVLELKTLFLQECFRRGVLTLGTHNICHALGEADVAEVLRAYDEVFAELRAALDRDDLRSRLRCPPLQPVFAVR
ncbi:MAG: aminotransferase class III-fold pyridoxal phosphate-dependent enzyme [Planctomycetes bacterium]|nr:aminotransferase class III-fold pyridoxal phosphate-dependent enzyme [Planctomycetota bacterium]